MINDYLNNLRNSRQSHPISQADWEAWSANPITKQLFEDAEILAIELSQVIPADNADTAGLCAAKLNGVRETTEAIIDWVPEWLQRNDD